MEDNPQVVHCAECDKEDERGVFQPTATLLAEELAQAHDVVNRRFGIAALPTAIADIGEPEVPRHVALRQPLRLAQHLQPFGKPVSAGLSQNSLGSHPFSLRGGGVIPFSLSHSSSFFS